jgi:type IV secretion system protein VirB2
MGRSMLRDFYTLKKEKVMRNESKRVSFKRVRGAMRHLWVMLLVVPGAGHAASIETVLNNGVKLLQGPIAKGVGLMAIIGSGYLCLARNKLPKEQFVMILVGLGIIFGGTSLYSALVG